MRHDRNREPRAHGDRARGYEREDLALELLLEQRSRRGAHIVPPAELDSRRRQFHEAALEHALLSQQQRPHPEADGLQSRRVVLILVLLQGPDVHHVELVEIRAHDGEEVEPLEQGRGRILRHRQHPALELERAEIRIEKQVRVLGADRRRWGRPGAADPAAGLRRSEDVGAQRRRQCRQRVGIL